MCLYPMYHVLKAHGSLAYFEFWHLVKVVLVICLYYKSTFTFYLFIYFLNLILFLNFTKLY